MKKTIGFKNASITVTTPDGKDLAPKLKKVIWDYMNEMRGYSPTNNLDITAFMLYCSYVSRNAEDFGLDDFSFNYNYSIDMVLSHLGNDYLARDFMFYYMGLCEKNPILPDLRDMELYPCDLSRAITSWMKVLDASKLSLVEGASYETAHTIQTVLAEMMTSTSGRHEGECSSQLPVAGLVVNLADVEGKDVLDFACGNGIYLATALSHGASAVHGRDINLIATYLAKIMCFFADPQHAHDVSAADALTAASVTRTTQRVLVSPPVGMPLNAYRIPETGYFADTLETLVGKDAPQPRNFEDFCVAKALAALEDGGVAVLHVSNSFLFHQHKGREAIRRAIVEKGYLRTVIELPGGCIPATGIKSALLVLQKEVTDEGVYIVDFDSKELDGKGYITKGRGQTEITEAGIEWLVDTVAKREEIPFVSTIADREAILTSGSNLCYSVYGEVYDYQTVLEQTRTTKDIVTDIKATQATIEELDTQIAAILDAIDKEA